MFGRRLLNSRADRQRIVQDIADLSNRKAVKPYLTVQSRNTWLSIGTSYSPAIDYHPDFQLLSLRTARSDQA
jgi:hypothetical protein